MLYQLLLIGTWNIPFLIFLTSIAAFYLLLLKRASTWFFRHLFPFLFGLILLAVTVDSPLSVIIHLSSSLHMIQMSILYFMIPPLILLGIPDHIIKKASAIPGMNIASKLLPSPMFCLISFAALFFMYHFPMTLQILSNNELLQNGYQGLLFILAFRMWWPIAVPMATKTSHKQRRKRYIFLSGLFLMPACLLFILYALLDGSSTSSLDQANTSLCLPPQSGITFLLPPPFHTKLDQFAAGFIMMGLHKVSLLSTSKLSHTKNIRYTYSHMQGTSFSR